MLLMSNWFQMCEHVKLRDRNVDFKLYCCVDMKYILDRRGFPKSLSNILAYMYLQTVCYHCVLAILKCVYCLSLGVFNPIEEYPDMEYKHP